MQGFNLEVVLELKGWQRLSVLLRFLTLDFKGTFKLQSVHLGTLKTN